MYEKILYTETMEQTASLFGNFDMNAAKLEKAFGVSITNRESDRSGGDAVIIRSEDSDSLLSAFSAPPVIGIDGLQLRAACIPLQTGSSGCIVHGTSLLVVGYCSRFFRVLQGT